MKCRALVVVTLAIASLVTGAAVAQRKTTKLSAEAARGRYLVQIAGCNDCHTPGYTAAGGRVAENLWLTGDQLGWRGPWGTTYGSNLRLLVKDMSANQFVKVARREFRPPMPWFNLRAMTDHDLKAIYAFLQYLGPAGKAAPHYVPPERTPTGLFVQFPTPPK